MILWEFESLRAVGDSQLFPLHYVNTRHGVFLHLDAWNLQSRADSMRSPLVNTLSFVPFSTTVEEDAWCDIVGFTYSRPTWFSSTQLVVLGENEGLLMMTYSLWHLGSNLRSGLHMWWGWLLRLHWTVVLYKAEYSTTSPAGSLVQAPFIFPSWLEGTCNAFHSPSLLLSLPRSRLVRLKRK